MCERDQQNISTKFNLHVAAEMICTLTLIFFITKYLHEMTPFLRALVLRAV